METNVPDNVEVEGCHITKKVRIVKIVGVKKVPVTPWCDNQWEAWRIYYDKRNYVPLGNGGPISG